MTEAYETHAKKYEPLHKRILFVAEAPPCSSERYFYYEDVRRDDWLWIALMKALYPETWRETRLERSCKAEWLERFKKSGYFLIDSVKTPITGSKRKRIAEISRHASELIPEIRAIKPEKIVLIKKTVHDALFNRMRADGIPVFNEVALPFPSSGQQTNFQNVFSSLDL